MAILEYELSPEDMEKLAEIVSKYRDKIKVSGTMILDDLGEIAQLKMKDYIKNSTGEHSVDRITKYKQTHNLENSVGIDKISDNELSVYTDNPYAAFVEFGTGIQGKESTHPNAEDSGWEYGFVTGQHSHQYLYKTYSDIDGHFEEMAEEILKKVGL